MRIFLLVWIFVFAECAVGYGQIASWSDSTLNVGDKIVSRAIFFPYNSSAISAESHAFLDSIAAFLIEHVNIKLEVGVHTDSRGQSNYSTCLSCSRAKEITKYLIANGVRPNQLQAQGYNDRELIVSDREIDRLKTLEEKERAHQINRRVEFKVIAVDFLPKNIHLYLLDCLQDSIMITELKPLLYYYSEDTLESNLIEIPLIDTNEFYSSFKGNGLEIFINCEIFYPWLHGIACDLDSLEQIRDLSEIDGKLFWGTDGTVPKTKVHSLKVSLDGVHVPIPESEVDGLYNPNFGCNRVFCYNFVYQSKDKKRIYIRMDNSDGAGFYQVIWIIQEGKYLTRVIDRGR